METSQEKLPLLSFVMMVYNEAESIEKTLAAILPHVAICHIIDTGSSDNTVALIEKAYEQYNEACECSIERMPRSEWQHNFALVRNRLLQAVDGRSVWVLTMDGHDEIHGIEQLVQWLAEQPCDSQGLSDDVYRIFIRQYESNAPAMGTHVAPLPRVFRADILKRGWRYEMPVHEVLFNTNDLSANGEKRDLPLSSEQVYILHDRSRDQQRTHQRMLSDRIVLQEYLRALPVHHPLYHRALRYCGMTEFSLQSYQAAAVFFGHLAGRSNSMPSDRANALHHWALCQLHMATIEHNNKASFDHNILLHALYAGRQVDQESVDSSGRIAETLTNHALTANICSLAPAYMAFLKAHQMSPHTQAESLKEAAVVALMMMMPLAALQHAQLLCATEPSSQRFGVNERLFDIERWLLLHQCLCLCNAPPERIAAAEKQALSAPDYVDKDIVQRILKSRNTTTSA